MTVKVKKLNENAVLPAYSKEGDAYMDIVATSKTIVNEKNYGYIEYGTSLSFEIPEGYFMDIRPRSSISNTGMIMRNAPAVIDENYRGEVKLRFLPIPETIQYEIGQRIAQIAVLPIPKIEWEEVQELTETIRGDQGFGSSGK